jgi:hypothetical protein
MKVSVAGTANRIFLPATSFHCGDYSRACLRRGAAWEMYDAPQALFTGPFVPGYNLSGIPGISNIKAYVWWASWSWWYLTDYSAGAPSVGFFAMLDQARFTQDPPADELATHQVEHEGFFMMQVFSESLSGLSNLNLSFKEQRLVMVLAQRFVQ